MNYKVVIEEQIVELQDRQKQPTTPDQSCLIARTIIELVEMAKCLPEEKEIAEPKVQVSERQIVVNLLANVSSDVSAEDIAKEIVKGLEFASASHNL